MDDEPSGMPDPGWYADPSGGPDAIRRWDGSRWTDDVADRPRGRGALKTAVGWGLTAAAVSIVVSVALILRAQESTYHPLRDDDLRNLILYWDIVPQLLGGMFVTFLIGADNARPRSPTQRRRSNRLVTTYCTATGVAWGLLLSVTVDLHGQEFW